MPVIKGMEAENSILGSIRFVNNLNRLATLMFVVLFLKMENY